MPKFFAVLAYVVVGTSTALAQEADRPETLIEFLRPGTKVGIYAPLDANYIRISIFSDRDFAIVSDARVMPLERLAAKYESVEKARRSKLEEFKASLASRADKLPARKTFGEPQAYFRTPRDIRLGTVKHVGHDYVLVSYGEGPSDHHVYASSFIATIGWFSVPRDSLGVSVGYVDKPEQADQRETK